MSIKADSVNENRNILQLLISGSLPGYKKGLIFELNVRSIRIIFKGLI